MKHCFLFCTIALFFVVNPISAQVFKVSAFGQNGIMMGDITNNEINSATAGYVYYGSNGGIEANFYLKNNFGFGIRWLGAYYGRDVDSYETDLKQMLGISNNNYDITQTYDFVSFGSDIGISYLMNLSEKLQLEPYFYFGLNGLISPMTEVIYSLDNTTYQYKNKSMAYFGFSYSPGVKLNWNIWKHIGLNFSVEYDGNSFMEDKERSMIFSSNKLEITDTKKSYKINSVNIGMGLSFRFGKGLQQ